MSASCKNEQALVIEIQALEKKMKFVRLSLRMHKHPLRTLRLFFLQTGSWIKTTVQLFATHPLVTFFALPTLILWFCLEQIPNAYSEKIDQFEKAVKFIIWWIGLGVLSSVGLGTGMHSGVLFLFPHIMKVCLAAQECNSLDFDSTGDMWFSKDSTLFACPEDECSVRVSYVSVVLKVYPACLLWGIGTAIGEIPPYAVSRAAALAGVYNEETAELEKLEREQDYRKLGLVTKMKVWMVHFLQKHGFLGVFLMSAWPNMAFDLCGICCGHFLMPFWTFFGATVLGKAGVKVLLQALFFTMLFTESALDHFVGAIRRVTPKKWGLANFMRDVLVSGKAQFHTKKGGLGGKSAVGTLTFASQLKDAWTLIMISVIVFFAVSCVEQFAQMKAASLDAAAIEEIRKEAGACISRNSKPKES